MGVNLLPSSRNPLCRLGGGHDRQGPQAAQALTAPRHLPFSELHRMGRIRRRFCRAIALAAICVLPRIATAQDGEGRYQIVVVPPAEQARGEGPKTILLDTKTGQTWTYSQTNSSWSPLPFVSNVAIPYGQSLLPPDPGRGGHP